jgi:hypothetical protein
MGVFYLNEALAYRHCWLRFLAQAGHSRANENALRIGNRNQVHAKNGKVRAAWTVNVNNPMQRNLENVFRPHQAKSSITAGALGGLSRKGFRTAHANAGPQYGQNWFHKSSGRKRRIRRGIGERILPPSNSFWKDPYRAI